MPIEDRPSSRQHDLKRARNPGAIAAIKPCSCLRIEKLELVMQSGGSVAFKPRADVIAYLFRNRRHGRETARQRIEIEASAADHDCGPRLAFGRGEFGSRLATPG